MDDDQLRARIRRLESGVDPDVEAQFAAVLQRAGRRRRGSAVGTALRDLAVTAAVVVVAITAFVFRGTPPGPAAQPLELRSVPWRTTLAASNPDVVREGLAGTWTIAFDASGGVTLTAPLTYLAPTTGYRFQVAGDRLAIGLFVERCAGAAPGDYAFRIDRNVLRFELVRDDCPHRVTFLTAQPWTAVAP